MTNRLSCPIPTNINPLSPNGFMFSIQKLPSVTFFCQEASIPSMILGSPTFNNPFASIPLQGEMLSFEPLKLQFLIDEDMLNYKAVHHWMVGLGFPENYNQYIDFTAEDTLSISEVSKGYSDATLTILGSNNVAVQSIRFIDTFPTNIESLSFQSTNNDVRYLVGSVSFKYSYYKFA